MNAFKNQLLQSPTPGQFKILKTKFKSKDAVLNYMSFSILIGIKLPILISSLFRVRKSLEKESTYTSNSYQFFGEKNP